MNKIAFVTSLSVAAVAVVAAAAFVSSAQAGTNKYSFVARAIVTDVDLSTKTIKADVTKVTGKGKDDMEGNNKEFVVTKATVYKVTNGKDKRVTYKNLVIGQEIGIKGVAKEDDTFELSFIRIHERKFTVIGVLQAHDETAKTIKVLLTSSTYKPTDYKKGIEVTMSYTDDSKFRNKTTELSFSDVDADAQRVKVTGTIEGSTWKVGTLWNNHKGK